MTAPALLRKTDMRRAAEVANETGCRIEIKVGDSVITVIPEDKAVTPIRKSNGIDYTRPVF
jgi:hypothetical protein